jgi:DNA mismatch repair protein MutH
MLRWRAAEVGHWLETVLLVLVGGTAPAKPIWQRRLASPAFSSTA